MGSEDADLDELGNIYLGGEKSRLGNQADRVQSAG